MESYRFDERRIATTRGAEDVGGESAVTRSGLHQIEMGFGMWDSGENRGHLGELNLEELAEDGAHIDAGKKIARASRPLGRAGVVAELGIVKRQLHERRHRHRAALTDELDQAIPSSPSRTPRRRCARS